LPVTRRRVQSARKTLYRKYRDRFAINTALNRSVVSYQANRNRPFYRWIKYKEGFSAALVEYILDHFRVGRARIMDPFAGTGAALLVGAERGHEGFGIELLPIGVKVIEARLAATKLPSGRLAREIERFHEGGWKTEEDPRVSYRHLRITQGAFSEENERQLNQFRTYLSTAPIDADVRCLLDLACLSVLEATSFTRKDGQYLRWDHRAPRERKGKKFDKGKILSFEEAMARQLTTMLDDMAASELSGRSQHDPCNSVEIVEGSCLKVLPTLPTESVDLVVTSPPYCNRYDYTRTYALELAHVGVDEDRLKDLRQELLSCTVENRSKIDLLRAQYGESGNHRLLEDALYAFENQAALQEILGILDGLGQERRLNNSNVPRMVRNYFLESSVTIFELARAVKPGGRVVMVNDNVQYGGEEVPVDLILCDLASKAGFETETIWVLARGKGNSSQQMGAHGRNELRKCAYVWRRE